MLPYREVADLEELDADEAAELWPTVTRCGAGGRTGLPARGHQRRHQPRAAGGRRVSEHLHVHVVPRWTGDANFMTAVANTRTLPEALVDTAAKIRAAWPGPVGSLMR